MPSHGFLSGIEQRSEHPTSYTFSKQLRIGPEGLSGGERVGAFSSRVEGEHGSTFGRWAQIDLVLLDLHVLAATFLASTMAIGAEQPSEQVKRMDAAATVLAKSWERRPRGFRRNFLAPRSAWQSYPR